MTITLEIPAETESILSAKAALFGLALPDYVFSLCRAAADDYYSLSVEEIAGVQKALEDIEAGDRGISLEELDEKMKANSERRKQKAAEVTA